MRPRTLVLLGLAGIFGPVLFITVVIVQGLLQPDYSHIAMPISALAAWPFGWLQNLNFFILAGMNAAFTIGLHNAIRPARSGFIGIALLLASCVGLMLAGLFPWINVNGVPTETPPHVVGAVTTFLGASTGLILLARRMKVDTSWRSLSGYVLGTGVVMLVLFVVVGFFAVDPGTPFQKWAGLLQRVLVAVWVGCQLVMARKVMGSRGRN
jgi:hypothetical membrane protein